MRRWDLLMRKTFLQYAAITSKWAPNNPIRAFLPFVYNYVLIKKPQNVTLEEISSQLDELYGLHLTYSLLRSILEVLRKNGEAVLSNCGYWSFNIKEQNEIINIENDFEQDIDLLIEDFKAYVGGDITKERAEELINSFFSRYDYEVLNGQVSSIEESQLDDYDYFVAEYIKHIKEKNDKIFNFILKIAQGSLIKTTITSENLNLTVFSNRKFYLDTKLVFRLIGYYGFYYQNEYEDLISTLRKQSAKIFISEYVYIEALEILRGCEKYIDSADYQYEKASDVLRYFRSLKYTKQDIQRMITSFEDLLNQKYGIMVDRMDVYNDLTKTKQYNEDYTKLREHIVDKYGYINDEYSYVYKNGLETDLKSVMHAYLKRANNEVVLIKDSPLFFVTTNGALVKSVMSYHLDVYGKKLSPVLSDTFLGVLLYNSKNNLQEYSKIKLLAFCNEAYKPTVKQREEFINCVERVRKENNLTDDQTFLLKNYELIDDVLIRQLRANDFNINDDCVYDTLEVIQSELVKDVSFSYERKIDASNKEHEKVLCEQKDFYVKQLETAKSEYDCKLNEKDEELKTYKNNLYEKELGRYAKRITPLYYTISTVVLLVALFVFITPFIFSMGTTWYSIMYQSFSGLFFAADIVGICLNIKSKKIYNYFLEKKKKKLKDKYQII